MLRSVIFICMLLRVVLCGPDLCENGAKIDSIAWVSNKEMWFFTSGGHFWFIKEKDFPPNKPGKPLPADFKKGEAAYYWNSQEACSSIQSISPKPEAQNIYLTELSNHKNQLLVFNTKNGDWLSKIAEPYDKNKGLSQAKVAWTASLDAAFIYNQNKIVVIQNMSYSVVDIKKLCTEPDGYGDGKQPLHMNDFNVIQPIDAIAAVPYDRSGKAFYLFQDSIFFNITVRLRESDGKIETQKSVSQDIVTQFFKMDRKCKQTNKEETLGTTVNPTEGAPQSEITPEDTSKAKQSKSEEGGFPWIIVIIIVIIIVLIAIVLIVCLLMRKSKSKEVESGAANSTEAASTTGTVRSAPPQTSKIDSSASQMTGQVGEGSATKSGSKLSGSTAGSKSSSKTVNANLGESPSTMSVRSQAGLTTTKPKNKLKNKK